jgi:hypothetical protein
MRAERTEYGSYSSHRSTTSHSLLLLLLTATTGFCAQPAAPKLLPETAVLDRVDGKLSHVDANDTWLFELTAEVKTPDYQLPATARFVLLPSATLGQLVADVNERVAPRYRLSARITLYRGKNYLFPIRYLPLSKFKDDTSPEDGDANQKPKIENQKLEEPELAIPPEVLEQLKKQPPLRGPRRRIEKPAAPGVPDRVLVDCVGRIGSRRPNGGTDFTVPSRLATAANSWIFVPYALGWNLSDVRYKLLPCSALEEALRIQKQVLDPIRFNVAGLVTEFQGQKCLLLQRAIVVYNYGNFGR